MAGLDVKVSQLGEVVVASDNDLLNLVTYDEQNQTYISGKVKASTMKDYMIGDTDISELGDGTPTGAIDTLDGKIDDNHDEWKEQWKKNGAYNLCPNENTTQIIDGVTFTVNSDGSVTANGTCGSTGADFDVPNRNTYNLGIGTYKLVGCPSGGSTSSYMIGGKINGSWVFDSSIDTGNGAVINVTSAINAIVIRIKPNTVCNNLLFKPMITTDLNATYADYVEYAKTNRELTEFTQGLDNLLHSPNTNDAMASSVASTRTAVFSGNGSAYTGTLPNGNYRYGIFISIPRNVTGRVLLAFAPGQGIAMNYYTGSTWDGWHSINIDS